MTAVSKIAEDMLQGYKNILEIRENFRIHKMHALKRQYHKYVIFDFEHPYYDNMDALDVAVKNYRQTIKSMMDVTIDGSSFRNEWEKVKMFAILSDKPVDELMENLLKLKQRKTKKI